jgi:hypothetical protein
MLWVRPGFLDAKASLCCCVKVLMQVDLPAFERPTKANSGKFSAGKKSSEGAVVKNLAVCIQPMAIFWAAACISKSSAGMLFVVKVGAETVGELDIPSIRTQNKPSKEMFKKMRPHAFLSMHINVL